MFDRPLAPTIQSNVNVRFPVIKLRTLSFSTLIITLYISYTCIFVCHTFIDLIMDVGNDHNNLKRLHVVHVRDKPQSSGIE